MMKDRIIGIDLGGTGIKFGLFAKDGTLLSKWTIPTRPDNQGEYILSDIAASIAQNVPEMDRVEAVGIGVPGAVKRASYVAPCVNLNQWGGFDVAQALSEKLHGLPVKAVNDANAATLGEMWQGGAKGCDNTVFVTLGTGVGGGIVVNGQIIEGVHGAGGEIGHIKLNNTETQTCGCGKHGCLEQYASATGIVRLARNALRTSVADSCLRNEEELSCRTVFDAAKEGDSIALSLVDDFADALGRSLANISCVCDPEVIVIGGGVSAAGQMLLDAVQKKFQKYAFPAAEGTLFRLATLGNDAGIYGSARLVLTE